MGCRFYFSSGKNYPKIKCIFTNKTQVCLLPEMFRIRSGVRPSLLLAVAAWLLSRQNTSWRNMESPPSNTYSHDVCSKL